MNYDVVSRMAVVLGNIALVLDPGHVSSPRICTFPERKSHRPVMPVLSDVVLNPFKKEYFVTNSLEFDGDVRKEKSFVKKGMLLKSKVDAVDYENSSDDENGNGNEYNRDEGDDGFDWEKEMRRRLKEIEEFRELEKKAEEVQNRVDEELKEDEEENEEEKRMRVRKELEKARPFSLLVLLVDYYYITLNGKPSVD